MSELAPPLPPSGGRCRYRVTGRSSVPTQVVIAVRLMCPNGECYDTRRSILHMGLTTTTTLSRKCAKLWVMTHLPEAFNVQAKSRRPARLCLRESDAQSPNRVRAFRQSLRQTLPVTHIAANDITIGGRRLRQRCAWCGAILLDYDLTKIAVQVEPGVKAEPPATYPVGRLVRVEGGGGFRASVVLDDTDELPGDACASVHDEVTR